MMMKMMMTMLMNVNTQPRQPDQEFSSQPRQPTSASKTITSDDEGKKNKKNHKTTKQYG